MTTTKRGPGRPRAKNSKLPFAGLGLEPYEEQELKQRLEEKDLTYRRLARKLVRDWLKENKPR